MLVNRVDRWVQWFRQPGERVLLFSYLEYELLCRRTQPIRIRITRRRPTSTTATRLMAHMIYSVTLIRLPECDCSVLLGQGAKYSPLASLEHMDCFSVLVGWLWRV